MTFKIVTDSAANLPTDIIKDKNITVIPLPYFINGEERVCENIDDFDDTEYYNSIADGMKVSTSQINPQRYIEYLEPMLKNGDDILFVGLSSGVSGSFSSLTIACEQLAEKYPERKISIVDSLGASMGEGLVVIKAVECAEKGMAIDDTEKNLNEYVKRVCQIFTVDDLMHLRRTGRLSNISAIVGTVLGIKPLLKGSTEGKIVAYGKIRGKKKAIEAIAEKYASLVKNTDRIGISYTGCKADADYLIGLINEKCPPDEIITVKHEPATGSHLGPGAIALYFEGDNQVREK